VRPAAVRPVSGAMSALSGYLFVQLAASFWNLFVQLAGLLRHQAGRKVYLGSNGRFKGRPQPQSQSTYAPPFSQSIYAGVTLEKFINATSVIATHLNQWQMGTCKPSA
jgi:hypothetical protein